MTRVRARVVLCRCWWRGGVRAETGLIVEVRGAGGMTSTEAGITKLDFVVAHPSWCERWVRRGAGQSHARDVERARPRRRSRTTSSITPSHTTDLSEQVYVAALAYDAKGSSSARRRSTRTRSRRARCSSARRHLPFTATPGRARRIRHRRRLRVLAGRAVDRHRQRHGLRHARHHQLRSARRHRRLRADAQGRAAAGAGVRRAGVHGRADRSRAAVLERRRRQRRVPRHHAQLRRSERRRLFRRVQRRQHRSDAAGGHDAVRALSRVPADRVRRRRRLRAAACSRSSRRSSARCRSIRRRGRGRRSARAHGGSGQAPLPTASDGRRRSAWRRCSTASTQPPFISGLAVAGKTGPQMLATACPNTWSSRRSTRPIPRPCPSRRSISVIGEHLCT